MEQQDHAVRRGYLEVISGYVLWGLLPIFWKLLDHVNAFEVLLHRILWCGAWVASYFLITGRNPLRVLRTLWLTRPAYVWIFSALIVSANWLTYIYAVISGNILQASLGYFLCPIMIVLLGVIFFKETMTALQKAALICCTAGVVYASLMAGGFPWLSVLIGGTFALYSTIKKFLGTDGLTALLRDTLLLTPLAVLIMGFLAWKGESSFLSVNLSTDILLVTAGLATLLPLYLFIQGTITIPYQSVGFLQFIIPFIAFMLGVFVYGEPFSRDQGITFGLIIIGVGCYIASLLMRSRVRP